VRLQWVQGFPELIFPPKVYSLAFFRCSIFCPRVAGALSWLHCLVGLGLRSSVLLLCDPLHCKFHSMDKGSAGGDLKWGHASYLTKKMGTFFLSFCRFKKFLYSTILCLVGSSIFSGGFRCFVFFPLHCCCVSVLRYSPCTFFNTPRFVLAGGSLIILTSAPNTLFRSSLGPRLYNFLGELICPFSLLLVLLLNLAYRGGS